MGHSAKVHKRVKKQTTGATQPSKPVAPPPPPVQTVQSAKKRAGLKSKAKARGATGKGHVLGGADYVTLLLGGRRKAAEEAERVV